MLGISLVAYVVVPILTEAQHGAAARHATVQRKYKHKPLCVCLGTALDDEG